MTLDETRKSWNAATARHNAHKRDQAAFLQAGGSTLFPDELELLGDVRGQRLLHVLCNSGQDTLSLARLGAECVGVDLSDQAIATARALSRDSGIPATFVEREVQAYLADTTGHAASDDGSAARFDVVFGSYGCLAWIEDLPRFLRGCARRLVPGGRAVFVEIHPLAWSLAWSLDEAQRPGALQGRDPYFSAAPFVEPVGDYVGAAGGALSPSGHAPLADDWRNPHAATAWQHTTADVLQGLIDAGLVVTTVREWPYVNGCRVHEGLVPRATEGVDARRFTTPAGVPSLPLMLGVVATAPR